MSLLVAGSLGVYITPPILRGDTVGLQDMEITHYDSMFGVEKDVLGSLWDAGLCLLQGTCAFVVEATTGMVTSSLVISIMGLVSGRNSKESKILFNYPPTREISVLSFCHCDIRGVKNAHAS